MPSVYDKEGRELTVGAEVRLNCSALQKPQYGVVRAIHDDPDMVRVSVEWQSEPGRSVPMVASSHEFWSDLKPGEHRAADLLLIDSSIEGKEG
jgi:hypothetical protein